MIRFKPRDCIIKMLYKKVTTPYIKTEVMFLNQVFHMQGQTIPATDTQLDDSINDPDSIPHIIPFETEELNNIYKDDKDDTDRIKNMQTDVEPMFQICMSSNPFNNTIYI